MRRVRTIGVVPADSLVAVVRGALERPSRPVADRDDDRILDAAMARVAAYGTEGTTMESVARGAGVGRMTVYRRFSSKEQLLAALVWREARRVVAEVTTAAAAAPDLAGRVTEAFVASVRVAREHPLLDRLRRFEGATVGDLFHPDPSQLLDLAVGVAAGEIRRAAAAGEIEPVRPAEASQVGEAVVRLALSYLALPSPTADLRSDRAVRSLARTVLVPIVTGRRAADQRSPS